MLKVNERKTAKGTTYAVLKLTDLTSVFELFIFSDILNQNREILKEGNSLLLSLIKSSIDNENRFKRVNVLKISSLKDILSKPINQVTFDLKTLDEIKEVSKYLKKDGDTTVNIKLKDEKESLNFQLDEKRNIDRKTINLMRNKDISVSIS